MYAYLAALWVYLGFDVGTTDLLEDQQFFETIFWGYILGTIISGIVLIWGARYLSRILYINPYWWIVPLTLLTIYTALSYSGWITWEEDLLMMFILSIIGWGMRTYKFSRPAFILSFIIIFTVSLTGAVNSPFDPFTQNMLPSCLTSIPSGILIMA